jgi:flagellar biosynthetic protein FliR
MTPIIESLSALTNLAQNGIWSAFLVFLRVGAAMALLPAFGEQVVPKRIRLGLAICFTAVVLPAVADLFPPLGTDFALSVTVEVMAGLAIGISLRMFVFALQIAGTLAAQSTSLSQLFGGAGADPQPSMSTVFVMAGLALAVMAGLHIRVAELFILSYQILPSGIIPDGSSMADWGVSQVARAFSLAFAMASPFLAASVIYNIALGVINRAMPQMMVVFVGAPALTLGGLVLLAVATPLLMGLWVQALGSYFASPFTVTP